MTLKSELLNFLSRIPNTQTVPQRKALLTAVGFDCLNRQITWEGANLVFFSEFLELLYSEGQVSLQNFLRSLSDRNLNLVGLEDSQRLIAFAERVSALTPNDWNQEFLETSHDSGQVLNKFSKPQADSSESSECPYKGLFAFQQEDAKFFFGRERFTARLIESINSQPFLAIIGNSGVGKSSVIFAGLIPELEKLESWQFLSFRPKNSPFLQLAEGLLEFLNPALTKDEPQFIEEQAEYAESLKNEKLKLKDVLVSALAENHDCQHLLIIVDQFEELYTLCSPDDQNLFIKNLLEVIDSERDKENPDIIVVITLRVDFYGFALDCQPLAEVLQKWKPEILIGMSREELELAIEKPAEVVGLKVQDGLKKIILDEVSNNPGELPLLEFALEELWKQRSNRQLTIAAYQQIGGIEKALANYAEAVYKKFARKQPQIKHIFTQLVRFGEQTENTRRLATYDQIGASNWKLVSRLADNRLVVTGQNMQISQRTVEVVHEALIRGWERLQQWMAEDQEFRKWQDRLRFEMKTWEEVERSDSALLRGAFLVEAEDWLNEKRESITDEKEIEFIEASRQFQEQEDIERIYDLLSLSQKELQLKQQLISLVYAVKAGVKLLNLKESSEELKKGVIERLQQGSYGISEKNQFVGHTKSVVGLAFSQDGTMVASASDDHNFKVWNLSGKLLKTFEGHTDEVWGVSFSPKNNIIASASADRTVKLWDLDGTLLSTLKGHNDQVWGVRFSFDGQVVISFSLDRTIRLWNLDGTSLRKIEGHTNRLWAISLNPSGSIIASANVDNSINLWQLDGTFLRTLEGHDDRVWEICFSPDGQIIASASSDKTVKLWSLDGTLLKILEGHANRVYGVSFNPDGKIVASASADKTVKLWGLDGTLLKTLEGHTDRVYKAVFSPRDTTIASASADKTVKLWHFCETLQESRTLEEHTDRVYGVSFSPDGQMIASASADKTVKLWSLSGVSYTTRTLQGHKDRVWGVSFSPDKELIASTSVDKTVKLWNLDGEILNTLEGHTNRVYGVSFSPDGQIVASASADKTVKLWGLGGTLLNTLEGHTDQVWGVSFSLDGSIIASASADRTMRLWHTDGVLLRILEGHTDRVYGVSFSPDGRIIASVSLDKTVRLWSIDGKLLRTFEEHTDETLGVSFGPNSQIVASASADTTIKLWRVDPNDLISNIDTKLNKLLSAGCFWVQDYLKTNPNVSETDRNLCDSNF